MTRKGLLKFLERIFCHWIFEIHSISIPCWVFKSPFESTLTESLGRDNGAPPNFYKVGNFSRQLGSVIHSPQIFWNQRAQACICWTALAVSIPKSGPSRAVISRFILAPSRSTKVWSISKTVLSECLSRKTIWKRILPTALSEPVNDDYLRRGESLECSKLPELE